MKTKTRKRPILIWDTCEIGEAQAEYLLEQAKENGEELTEEQAREDAYSNTDNYQWQWEDLCDQLTEDMERKNPSGDWKAEVNNFGWRSMDGHAEFHAETGRELLQKILPQTDCTFKIYNHGRNGFAINNAHHDSPMWAEWYYIVPNKNREE